MLLGDYGFIIQLQIQIWLSKPVPKRPPERLDTCREDKTAILSDQPQSSEFECIWMYLYLKKITSQKHVCFNIRDTKILRGLPRSFSNIDVYFLCCKIF